MRRAGFAISRAGRRSPSRPLSNGSSPISARASAFLPEPSSPATPTISPLRTSKIDAAQSPVSRVAQRERGRSRRLRRTRRVEVGDIAADHRADESAVGASRERGGHDRPPVLEHGDAIGDRLNLGHPVRDIDDRHALGASLRTRSSKRAASTRSRAAVGSSMTRMRVSMASALAISTICWWAMERSPASESGATGDPSRLKSAARLLAHCPRGRGGRSAWARRRERCSPRPSGSATGSAPGG